MNVYSNHLVIVSVSPLYVYPYLFIARAQKNIRAQCLRVRMRMYTWQHCRVDMSIDNVTGFLLWLCYKKLEIVQS